MVIGDINDLDQVLQFMIVGAAAVQIGTANFYDPTISERLVDELQVWGDEQGMGSIQELVDTLQTG